MAIKLIAFDWNGTLLSDTVAAWQAGNETFKMYKMKPISLSEFRKTFSIPISKLWTAHGGDKKVLTKQALEYHPLYEQRAKHSRTRAGSKETLNWLKKQGIKKVIYSNHISSEIRKQLERLKINKYFPQILARSANDFSHVHSRGKEDKLVKFVRRHKYQPKEVLTVGDTEEEIEIGKRHRFHTVAITGGYNSAARLKKHKPDFLIHNMIELKNIIKKLKQ